MFIDIIIAAAVLISGVIGYKNGFIRTIFKFVGYIAGGVLGIYFSLKISHDWALDFKRIGCWIICRRSTCQRITGDDFSWATGVFRFSGRFCFRNHPSHSRDLLNRYRSSLVTVGIGAEPNREEPDIDESSAVHSWVNYPS